MKKFLLFIGLIVCFRLGIYYFSQVALFDRQKISFSATLFEDPKIIGNNQSFILYVGDFWKSTPIKITTTLDQDFSYGQEVEVSGSVKRKLLSNTQIVYTIQNPQIKAKNSGFLTLFSPIRQRIINFCENNFSQPYSGLLVGIIFGMKNLLTDQITRSFRITGLSHIVAASGMNITLVAGFLFGLFGHFLKRQHAIVISMVGILLYVCVTGFEASILRAAIMGSLAFSASLFGRQYSGWYILVITGLMMLFVSPLLLFDVGFQLSFLATAGILLLKPIIFGHEFFSEDLGITLSAQLATLPIILTTFGQYPVFSLLANLLVLWTIPLIMVIGGLGILIGIVVEPLGKMIVILIIPLLWYLQEITHFLSQQVITITISLVPPFLIFGYYCFLLAIIFVKRKVPLDSKSS